MTVSLRRLLPAASFVGCADVIVTDATERSNECAPGVVFAAIPGTRQKGVDFVPEALARGASALMTEQPLAAIRVPQCVVPDVRRAFAETCHALYGYPSWRLGLVGATGTNGKTTTTWLVRALLESAGRPTGILGTVEYSDGIARAPAGLTTPPSRTFAAWLASMVERKTRFAAVELSSHALDQQRCAGTRLDVVIVTNITQDHFDYHGTAAQYLEAKASILGMVKRGGLVVLNADDPLSVALASRVPATAQLTTFGLNAAADLTAHNVRRPARAAASSSGIGWKTSTSNCPSSAGTTSPTVSRPRRRDCTWDCRSRRLAPGYRQATPFRGGLNRSTAGRTSACMSITRTPMTR
jgi:UDP-N-acetylmuramoyl-L-alanyl-D-glutamate--2,6-diaminopimelate ligase